MSMLLAVWMGYAVFGWAADEAEQTSADARPRATATAPADGAAGPRGGLRRRVGEGQRRRDPGPPPGPGQRRGERPRPGPPLGADELLAPEEIGALMEFTREHFPPIYLRLERLRRVDAREFQRMLRRTHNRLKPMMDMHKANPRAAEKAIEEYRLQMVIVDLADQYRRAETDAERTRLKAEIETRIRERFDRHQERTRLVIEGLRKRLDEQERRLTERERDKETLLREELERTLKDSPSRGGGRPGPRAPGTEDLPLRPER